MDFELITMFPFQVYLAARDGLLGQLRRQMEILDKRVGPEEKIKIVNTKFEEGEQSCSLLIAAARNGHEEVKIIIRYHPHPQSSSTSTFMDKDKDDIIIISLSVLHH